MAMLLWQILIYILAGFAGYLFGRVSHLLGGHLRVPHHWIYGLVLLIAGSFLLENHWGLLIFCFGLGLFASDWKDFLSLKFLESDESDPKKFWGVD